MQLDQQLVDRADTTINAMINSLKQHPDCSDRGGKTEIKIEWIFDSNIRTSYIQDEVLIIENYLIELTDIEQLLVNPSDVVRCITRAESNNGFKFWRRTTSPHLKMAL